MLLGRPFMATTNMEINMRDRSVTMMVLGKKLRLNTFNDGLLPLYSSNDANYCFDEDMMRQVKESLKIIRNRPLHTEVQGERKPNKGGRTIWVPREKPRPIKNPSTKKKDFSTHFLHISSSGFDDSGYLKSKGEKSEEGLTLIGKKKGKVFLQNSEYEGIVDAYPNSRGEPSMDAGPNDPEEATDQHGESPP